METQTYWDIVTVHMVPSGAGDGGIALTGDGGAAHDCGGGQDHGGSHIHTLGTDLVAAVQGAGFFGLIW